MVKQEDWLLSGYTNLPSIGRNYSAITVPGFEKAANIKILIISAFRSLLVFFLYPQCRCDRNCVVD